MFEKLKKRWNVNGLNLVLTLTTFALGGSLCGYIGRKLLILSDLDKGAIWVLSYIVLVTLLWPICVILISIPLGRYAFFKKYLLRVLKKLTGKTDKPEPVRLAIFASGAGSNAQKIIAHFSSSAAIKVTLVVSNNPEAGVLTIANNWGIPTLLINKATFFNGNHYLPVLKEREIDFIILAGFLWKLPGGLINAFPKKIFNIHPALLPKYGGKGMYGHYVHEAVLTAGEKESGITIHFVDDLYDHGEIIFQAKCPVEEFDTPDTLAQKIRVLEHTHYPEIIEKIIIGQALNL